MVLANADLFEIREPNWSPGIGRAVISFKGGQEVRLSEWEELAINHVIKHTENLTWPEFLRLIHSTLPFMTSKREDTVNLKSKAVEYMEMYA